MGAGADCDDDFDLLGTRAPLPLPLPRLAAGFEEGAALVAGRASSAASDTAGLRRLGVVLTPPPRGPRGSGTSSVVWGRGVPTRGGSSTEEEPVAL